MALGWLCRRLPRGELFPNRSVPLFEGLKRWDKFGLIAEQFQWAKNGMAIPTGLEPVTFSLEGCCSIQLSYGTARVSI